jgi:hypothetical protein
MKFRVRENAGNLDSQGEFRSTEPVLYSCTVLYNRCVFLHRHYLGEGISYDMFVQSFMQIMYTFQHHLSKLSLFTFTFTRRF